MGKQKYYAVKIGREPGIYQSWSDAQKQVNTFQGAVYKSFDNLQDAESYLNSLSENTIHNEEGIKEINDKILSLISNLNNDQVIAFVDGSYSDNVDGKQKYGFGSIIVTSDSEVTMYKSYVNPEYMDSRNIAGEIEGVKQSILWAIENNKKEILICYDYEGIEKWANNEWKTTKKLTKEYKSFIDENVKSIEISFLHVKAHSGITYNERVDELAKSSLMAHGYRTYNDGSIYFIGFNEDDWIRIIDELSHENEELNNDENKSNNNIEYKITKPKDYLNKFELKYIKDSIVINCYKGNKSYVQGKKSVFFQRFISYAVENITKHDNVVDILSSYHSLTIEEIRVKREFIKLLPNFPQDFTDIKHYNVLLSSVFNTMLNGYMPEYTCLITPIFRAVEYYLHRILHDKLHNKTEENSKNKFNYFSKNEETNSYYYNRETSNLNDNQVSLLNEIYNYYNKIRHPYSHWALNSLDSHVITNMENARELLLKGLKLVNKYYIIF